MKPARRKGTRHYPSSLVQYPGILFAAFLLGLVLVAPELVHAQTTSGTTITIKTPSLTFTVDDTPGTTQFVELEVSAPFVGKNVGVKNLGSIWSKDQNVWTHRKAIVTVSPPARISHGFVSIPLIPPSTIRQTVTVPMKIPIRRKDLGNTAGTGSVRIAIYFHQSSPALFDIPITLAQLPTAPINPSLTSSNDLSNYPGLFIKDGSFNGVFVTSTLGVPADEQIAVDKIKKSLETLTGKTIPSDRIKTDNQITSLAQNMIVIGGPCGNSVSSRLRGNPDECATGFRPGEGIVQLFTNGGFTQIEVSGYLQEDMFAAADALANAPTQPLQGTRHTVTKSTPPVLTNGLVGYFPFDTDVKDVITQTIGKTNKITLIPGVYGKAASFDTTNRLDLGKYPPLRQTKGITFAFWANIPENSGGTIMETPSQSGRGYQQIQVMPPFPTFFQWAPQDTTPLAKVRTNLIIPGNTWNHFAFTIDYDGKTGNIYKNGKPETSRITPSSPTTWTPVFPFPETGSDFIGGGVTSFNGFQGVLDDVRIYDRALTESEVLTLATPPIGAILTPPPVTCPPGFGNCDYDPSNGCESNLNTVANCGYCGTKCSGDIWAPYAACENQKCVKFPCPTNTDNCDMILENGCETLLTTNNNCGMCGFTCQPGRSCQFLTGIGYLCAPTGTGPAPSSQITQTVVYEAKYKWEVFSDKVLKKLNPLCAIARKDGDNFYVDGSGQLICTQTCSGNCINLCYSDICGAPGTVTLT